MTLALGEPQNIGNPAKGSEYGSDKPCDMPPASILVEPIAS